MVSSAGSGEREGEGNDPASLCHAEVEMDFRDSLLLLCTRKLLFSFPCGDLVFLSFNTARERILIYERAVFFISSLRAFFFLFKRPCSFASIFFTMYLLVDSPRRVFAYSIINVS